MIIQHNLQAAFANGKVTSANNQKAANVEKLSSGYRINHAADDAAGLTISEKLRFQIRGLNQASDNIQDGISLTSVADGALTEIHSILQRQRELLVQAANDTNTTADRQAIEDELSSLSGEFDRIFNDTEFNTQKIFKGEETILAGPTITSNTVTNPPVVTNSTSTNTKDVWLPKTPAPDLTPPPTTTTNTSTTSDTEYLENETPHGVDDLNHASYDVEQIWRTTATTTTTDTTTTIEYTKIDNSDYTDLRKPGAMVGRNGYINVSNVKGNLDLSCAMSRLGVQIDGTLLSLDLYNGSIPKNTVISADQNIAETTFDLGDSLFLTQRIELTSNNEYAISYSLDNQGGTDHQVDVRLAFDVMNTEATSVNDGVTTSFNLQSDFAEIPINATNVDNAVLGDISDLYYQWGDRVTDGATVPYHTGVGYWWEGNTATAGGQLTLGTITYGPITLLKDPYQEKTTTETTTTAETSQTDVKTEFTYMPKYLDIQSGALARQNIPIILYDLSSTTLRLRVPTELSAFTAGSSLENVDRVIARISSIRSYYGTITNRLEHAYSVDQNTSENTQAAKSRIRDADMAEEMVDYSKNNILSQAAESMLAQSNHNFDQVLELLQ